MIGLPNYRDLGRLEEALTACGRAIEILARLVQGGRIELENHLASAHNNQGTALGELGRLEEALEAFERALAIFDRLVEVGGRIELKGACDAVRQNVRETRRRIEHKNENRVVDVPMAHPKADPTGAVARNIEYQAVLASWKALPWYKRWRTARPPPPND